MTPNKFMGKIAAASAEMTNPTKNSTNPHFRSKFASLEDTMAVIDPVLEKHGLGHYFAFDNTLLVYTVFDPENDTVIRSHIDLKDIMSDLQGNVWQSIGQAFTYLRRYLAQAFWNLVPEDDDGQSAPKKKTKLDMLKDQVRKRASADETTPALWLHGKGVEKSDFDNVVALEKALA